ncbi:MAG: efflux RND transporter periplasmic adaptor subunit, partial [Verrucomicrobiales bacterium]
MSSPQMCEITRGFTQTYQMRKTSILLFSSVILFVGCGKKEGPVTETVRNVRAMKVGNLDGLVGRSFPGRARAAQEVDLAFRVSGPLNAFPVNVGDTVNESDLIASIDPRDFDVALRNAKAGLQRAEATANRARLDLERMIAAQNTNEGAVSVRAVDQARENLEVANADIESFKASVEEAENSLEYTELRAPFSGTIVATFVENFENVREKQMVVRLLDKTQIEFEVGIPETLISLAEYVKDIE